MPPPEVLCTFDTALGTAPLLDSVNGLFGLRLTAAETSALSFKQAVYDLELTSPSGQGPWSLEVPVVVWEDSSLTITKMTDAESIVSGDLG